MTVTKSIFNLNKSTINPNKSTIAGAFIVFASVVLTTQAQAKDIQPFSAQYSFSVKDKVSGKGKATRTLKKSGKNWSYQTKAYALGGIAKANQSSNFILSAGKVKPTSAKTTYKVFGKSNVHKIKFNHKSVVSTYKGKPKTLSMSHQAYDDLSLETQIRQELLNGKFTGNYYMVKKDKVVKTKFRKLGLATVTTPSGTYKAVRVDRVHANAKRQTSFWLAPSLDYLPVKVVTKKKGTKMTLELLKLNK